MGHNPFVQGLAAEIRRAIAHALERWKPDLSNAEGVLPTTVLPVGGDTGTGFTPAPHTHPYNPDEYASKDSEYDAHFFWGRTVTDEAPITGQVYIWDGTAAMWTLATPAGGTGGGVVPAPYAYITDSDGFYLVDSDGSFLYEDL